ncbi:conserved hypothetical protein [Afipia carboxidovorans OM5]|nr:conserved hypothetical protein [Afipia carboxidovorans OM5]
MEAAEWSGRICDEGSIPMQLSDTQLIILSAASQRSDWHVLPLPAHLKGGAANKVIASLLGKNLIEECEAVRGDPIWRETGDGHGTTLVLTEHAFAALGIAPDAADDVDAASGEDHAGSGNEPDGEPEGDPESMPATTDAPEPEAPQLATGADTCADTYALPDTADHDASTTNIAPVAPTPATSHAPRPPRRDTKQARLIAMLRTPEGATIAEIVAVTGWQPHTVRGAMVGALKKKLGLVVTSEKIDGRGRVYAIHD